jgi:transketolase
MDAVQAADSGHPGTPMALAPVAYALWQNHLRFDPENPIWPNRDRFVLSAGHASMLLYALLHLTGTKAVNSQYETEGELAVKLDDIKRFRQLGSKCPGHPEYRLTSGVETTTGPLGQGIANSVGMAMSSRWLAERYNRADFKLFDFNVYAVCSDGDLMEGISGEAASLAGHLKLSNLCWIYDDNHITIEGNTKIAFSEDVAMRFKGYEWNVARVSDANNLEMNDRAIDTFKKTRDRPTLIIVRSHIGYGSPHKQDTAAAHGSALGVEEVRLTKKFYGWPENAKFYIPEEVRTEFREGIAKRGGELSRLWDKIYSEYSKTYPELADELNRMQHRELPENWDKDLPVFPADAKGMATRESSGEVLNILAKNIPWLVGGAGDLSPSTKTHLTFQGAGDFEAGHYGGRNLHFGIREHAMGAVLNGMALSKIRPFGATFLIFSDYERPTIRLSALMEIPVIHIFTHDSIGLGEDGPTHQPVSELVSLRTIPGLVTLRPADANEVVECWKIIMNLKHQPAALVLTRQNVPTFDRTRYAPAGGVQYGAYVLADCEGDSDVILLATGSEVSLCVDAYEELKLEGIKARVVSMPSWEIFESQSQDYQHQVLPPQVKARVSIEAASTFGWDRYVDPQGTSLGMRTFGASAPLKDLLNYFGFTSGHVVSAAKQQIEKSR